MSDIRCPECRRLLLRADVRDGVIEVKCSCRYVVRVVFTPPVAAIRVNALGLGIEVLDTRADGHEPQPLPAS